MKPFARKTSRLHCQQTNNKSYCIVSSSTSRSSAVCSDVHIRRKSQSRVACSHQSAPAQSPADCSRTLYSLLSSITLDYSGPLWFGNTGIAQSEIVKEEPLVFLVLYVAVLVVRTVGREKQILEILRSFASKITTPWCQNFQRSVHNSLIDSTVPQGVSTKKHLNADRSKRTTTTYIHGQFQTKYVLQ
jgi:hypothetical protein